MQKIVLAFGFTTIAIALLYYNQTDKFYLITLPISVILSTMIAGDLFNKISTSIVFRIFYIQVCIRYYLLPTLEITEQNIITGKYSNYIYESIVTMIIELLTCLFIFFIHARIQRSALTNSNNKIETIKNKPIILIILFFSLIFIYQTNIFYNVSFVWNLDSYVDQFIKEENYEVSSIGGVLFNQFKVIIALVLMSSVQEYKKMSSGAKNVLYLLIMSIASMVIVGISRFSLIFFALPLFMIMQNLTNRYYAKKNVILFIIIIGTSLTISTFSKFSRLEEKATFESVFSASTLNAYFSGYGNIATGYDAYLKTGIDESLLYLINDTFQNIPLISKLTSDEYKLTNTFNEYIYSHRLYADQIVPLSVSGLFHFGYLGISLYCALFITFALYTERLLHRSTFIGYKYILTLLSITYSLVFMLNLGSFYSTLSQSFLFLLIPFFVIRKWRGIKLS